MKALLLFFACCSAAYATNSDLSLEINSSPDSAQVYVNYQLKGTTPLSLSSLPQ
ncbi:MAG: PEGA domain-containing protein [Gemmatimonadota bacterium]|nr:MAG: PEGA domain-containing protein [Gemmatimonadota bacterium]